MCEKWVSPIVPMVLTVPPSPLVPRLLFDFPANAQDVRTASVVHVGRNKRGTHHF